MRLAALLPLWAAAAAAPERAPEAALLIPYAGIITPVAAEFIGQGLDRAEQGRYQAAVIQLDTPGGLDLSMRSIVQRVMASRVPVIVYVHPAGARAASAGAFIAMAAHVAAMTPGTNIGAAHPVSIPMSAAGGAPKPDRTLEEKARADAAAYLKSIAQKRGRNEAWAEDAVVKSASITASDAVRQKVVDLTADDVPSLLRAVDGSRLSGFDRPLRTAGARVDRFEMTRRQRWLAALCDPNVAMILMSLGGAGLLIELYNPGLILPGIVGAVSLLLAFYSFQTLSASYAGVLLILAGLVFLALEISVTSYGMLAVGGIASVALGGLMLFSSHALGGIELSTSVLGGTVAGLALLAAAASRVALSALGRPLRTGEPAMEGLRGRAETDVADEGKVSVGGEIWDAYAETRIAAGEPVVVVRAAGMRLEVKRP